MANVPISAFTVGANTTGIGASGYSLTGSAANSYIDLAGTWNTSGTPTAIKLNITDTASNAASLLMDLQTGGTSRFNVTKAGLVTSAGVLVGPVGSNAAPTFTFTGETASGLYRVAARLVGITVNSSPIVAFTDNGGNAARFASWIEFSTVVGNAGDLVIIRDAANTLAQRNGTNAQTFRVYQSFTDSSNFTRGALSAASSIVNLAAESAGTGDANIDVQLTPKGTGRVRFGTHAAITTETVTGFIEIKDAGGTVRKVAIVS